MGALGKDWKRAPEQGVEVALPDFWRPQSPHTPCHVVLGASAPFMFAFKPFSAWPVMCVPTRPRDSRYNLLGEPGPQPGLSLRCWAFALQGMFQREDRTRREALKMWHPVPLLTTRRAALEPTSSPLVQMQGSENALRKWLRLQPEAEWHCPDRRRTWIPC